MAGRETADQFAAVARELHAQAGEDATLDRAVVIAAEVVDGAEHAGVSLVRANRSIRTVACTDPLVLRGDELQHELDEGPCRQAVRDQETVLSRDLRSEQRWPRWSPRVAEELGLRSLMCVRLFTSDRFYGGLNLYSSSPDAFDDQDLATGRALAAHVAVALAASRELDEKDVALRSRTMIGQAQGILMERFGLDAAQAFAALRRVSSHSNRKLVDVAEELVQTRRTPAS